MKNMLNRIFSYARFVNLLLTKNQTTRIFVDVFVVVTIPKKKETAWPLLFFELGRKQNVFLIWFWSLTDVAKGTLQIFAL